MLSPTMQHSGTTRMETAMEIIMTMFHGRHNGRVSGRGSCFQVPINRMLSHLSGHNTSTPMEIGSVTIQTVTVQTVALTLGVIQFTTALAVQTLTETDILTLRQGGPLQQIVTAQTPSPTTSRSGAMKITMDLAVMQQETTRMIALQTPAPHRSTEEVVQTGMATVIPMQETRSLTMPHNGQTVTATIAVTTPTEQMLTLSQTTPVSGRTPMVMATATIPEEITAMPFGTTSPSGPMKMETASEITPMEQTAMFVQPSMENQITKTPEVAPTLTLMDTKTRLTHSQKIRSNGPTPMVTVTETIPMCPAVMIVWMSPELHLKWHGKVVPTPTVMVTPMLTMLSRTMQTNILTLTVMVTATITSLSMKQLPTKTTQGRSSFSEIRAATHSRTL